MKRDPTLWSPSSSEGMNMAVLMNLTASPYCIARQLSLDGERNAIFFFSFWSFRTTVHVRTVQLLSSIYSKYHEKEGTEDKIVFLVGNVILSLAFAPLELSCEDSHAFLCIRVQHEMSANIFQRMDVIA